MVTPDKFDNETQEVREIGHGEIPGLLSRLMACATIQSVSIHQMPSQDEWIGDLELMGVPIGHRKNTLKRKGFFNAYASLICRVHALKKTIYQSGAKYSMWYSKWR